MDILSASKLYLVIPLGSKILFVYIMKIYSKTIFYDGLINLLNEILCVLFYFEIFWSSMLRVIGPQWSCTVQHIFRIFYFVLNVISWDFTSCDLAQNLFGWTEIPRYELRVSVDNLEHTTVSLWTSWLFRYPSIFWKMITPDPTGVTNRAKICIFIFIK